MIVRFYGHGRSGGPSHFHGEVVEHRARSAFENKAIGADAAKENAVLRCIEGKEVGPPHQIGPLVILQFEHLAVGAEKARRVGVARQANSKKQQRPLVLLVFEQGVAVGRPCRGQIGGAIFGQKLLEDFLETEFPHIVFIELFPVRGNQARRFGQLDFGRHDVLQVHVRMHDLLRRNRRLLENLVRNQATRSMP